MQWLQIEKEHPIPFESERIVQQFAWLPISINGITKWLENVTIKQQYQADGCADVSFSGWVNQRFEK